MFAQTAEILGFLVDFPAGAVQPKKGAIEKIFFVLFKIDACAPQTLRYWQCLSSLVTIMYSPVLRRMRPFIAQINAMTSKATQYRTAHATPSALFEIEIWRAAIIIVLMNETNRARGSTAYVHQNPTKSQSAPNGVGCEPVAPVRCTILNK